MVGFILHKKILKKATLLMLSFPLIDSLYAQSFSEKMSIGFSGGGMKYIGGSPAPATKLGGSILGKYDITDQLHLRAQITVGTLASDPREAYNIPPPELTSFRLAIAELSILPEYDFININSGEKRFTPFIFAGISYFYYPRTYTLTGTITGIKTTYNYDRKKVPPIMNIPIGAGFKYTASNYVTIFGEGSFRLYLHQEFYSFAIGLTCKLSILQQLGKNKNYGNDGLHTNSKYSYDKCSKVYL